MLFFAILNPSPPPKKGAALLDSVRDLKLTKAEFEHASRANPMLYRSKEKSPQRELFAEVFAEKKGLPWRAGGHGR